MYFSRYSSHRSKKETFRSLILGTFLYCFHENPHKNQRFLTHLAEPVTKQSIKDKILHLFGLDSAGIKESSSDGKEIHDQVCAGGTRPLKVQSNLKMLSQ